MINFNLILYQLQYLQNQIQARFIFVDLKNIYIFLLERRQLLNEMQFIQRKKNYKRYNAKTYSGFLKKIRLLLKKKKK